MVSDSLQSWIRITHHRPASSWLQGVANCVPTVWEAAKYGYSHG